ncbi:MAG: GAF domain-containing protein [Caldilineales bacterium]|nr:GAF domain-containing protein [Caldilineales bacterium]MDW8317296.1 GAF domain-containing protein [Anaerolineae bacterium]
MSATTRDQVSQAPSRGHRLYRQILRLRWPILVIVVGAAAVHQAILFALLRTSPPPLQSLTQLLLYSATGVVAVWIGLRLLTRAMAEQERAEAELRAAYADLERTNRQLRVIYEVGRRVTNSSDVQELLEIAARIPVELLGAAGASVVTFDEERRRGQLELTYGLQPEAEQALRQQVQTVFSAQRCATCQPLTAHVNSECSLLLSLQSTGNGDGIDRIVCMPLGRAEQRNGVVSAYLRRNVSPSAEQLHLISILSAEITAALESARLRAQQVATLYAVDQATQERRSLDALLEAVLRSTLHGWGVNQGAILLVSQETGVWTVRAHEGMAADSAAASAAGLKTESFKVALRLAERAHDSGQAVLLQERGGDPALASVATVLLQAEGETLGALFLGSAQPSYFKPAHVQLLKAVGSQIALAIRNAQLYSQLRRTAVLEERYRLSREMHDGVAQTLGYLGMQAERLEQQLKSGNLVGLAEDLQELRRVIAEAYLDVRETIDGLRLNVDGPDGFLRALQLQIEDFRRRTGLAVECSLAEEAAELPAEVALHLLRIAQEALTNVRRHAQARRVWVNLSRDDGHLELSIADDGRGFNPDDPLDRHHVGLASMRERVRSLDGQLTLATGPGVGTRVTVRVPWPEAGA